MFVLISVLISSLFTPLPHDRTTETRNIKCENEVLNQEAAQQNGDGTQRSES